MSLSSSLALPFAVINKTLHTVSEHVTGWVGSVTEHFLLSLTSRLIVPHWNADFMYPCQVLQTLHFPAGRLSCKQTLFPWMNLWFLGVLVYLHPGSFKSQKNCYSAQFSVIPCILWLLKQVAVRVEGLFLTPIIDPCSLPPLFCVHVLSSKDLLKGR